jgi:hypothetical protein
MPTETDEIRCEDCVRMLCRLHLNGHSQEFRQQLDEIENNRDLFRDTLNEQKNDQQKHFLIKQIDQWEMDSIETIQQTAKECREKIFQHTNEHFKQMEVNLTKLTNLIREVRQDNTLNEIDLIQLKQKVVQLKIDLNQVPNVSIQQDSTPFINKISVIVSSSEWIY